MVVLFDTNVILDVLFKRKEFYQDSSNAIKRCKKNGDKLYVSASAITDIYYLVRKATKRNEVAFDAIKKVVRIFQVAEVNNDCIFTALKSKMRDFEDALVDSVATHIKADYIVTRNTKDFNNATHSAIEPKKAPLYIRMSDDELKNHYTAGK